MSLPEDRPDGDPEIEPSPYWRDRTLRDTLGRVANLAWERGLALQALGQPADPQPRAYGPWRSPDHFREAVFPLIRRERAAHRSTTLEAIAEILITPAFGNGRPRTTTRATIWRAFRALEPDLWPTWADVLAEAISREGDGPPEKGL